MVDTLADNDGETSWNAAQSPGFLLWHVQNSWQRRQREALESAELTPVQFLLLSGAADAEAADGPPSQIALARRCRTDPMMTSQVVRTLERAGLVERIRQASDRRARAVRLTSRGAERLAAARGGVQAVEAEFFAALGADVPAFTDALRLLGGERPRRRVQAVTRRA